MYLKTLLFKLMFYAHIKTQQVSITYTDDINLEKFLTKRITKCFSLNGITMLSLIKPLIKQQTRSPCLVLIKLLLSLILTGSKDKIQMSSYKWNTLYQSLLCCHCMKAVYILTYICSNLLFLKSRKSQFLQHTYDCS